MPSGSKSLRIYLCGCISASGHMQFLPPVDKKKKQAKPVHANMIVCELPGHSMDTQWVDESRDTCELTEVSFLKVCVALRAISNRGGHRGNILASF